MYTANFSTFIYDENGTLVFAGKCEGALHVHLGQEAVLKMPTDKLKAGEMRWEFEFTSVAVEKGEG